MSDQIYLTFNGLVLVISLLLLGPILCCGTVILTNRWHSKAERAELDQKWQELEGHKKHQERVDRIQLEIGKTQAERQQQLDEWAEKLRQVRHQANDVATFTKAEAEIMEDETRISIMDWEGLEVEEGKEAP